MKKVIGTGAAGNKAAIRLIEDKIVKKENVILLNTTIKDIPAEYKDIFIKVGDGIGGAGKEVEKGKQYLIDSLNDGSLASRFDSLLDPDDDGIIIITSTEGGSGSGSAPTIAEYFKDVIGTNVHIVAFTGFEDDPRGISNTISFFKNLNASYTFQIISNKKFMDECDNNKIKAQNAANVELSQRIKTLLGQTLIDCEQNIDQTDLYKTVNTPGLLTVETGIIKNLKNTKQFNDILNEMIDNSKSIDINENGVLRLAIILNINERTTSCIDFDFTAIRNKLGMPFEWFSHIQNTNGDEFVSIIASGMRLPEKEIQDMYTKYQDVFNKVNTKKDPFFENISGLNTTETNVFNVEIKHVNEDMDDRRKKFLSSQSKKLNKSDNGKVIVSPELFKKNEDSKKEKY